MSWGRRVPGGKLSRLMDGDDGFGGEGTRGGMSRGADQRDGQFPLRFHHATQDL